MRWILAVLIFIVCAPLAHAQEFDIPNAQSAAVITMEPAYPSPKATVRLMLKSPLYDVENAYISWRIDGAPYADGDGLSSITIALGDTGESVDISATMTSGGNEVLAFTTITPARVDLLWESNGYTPAFYKGRALASAGSKITLVALPTFIQNGVTLAAKDLVYTWRRNDVVLGSLSGRGKSSIVTDAPLLFGVDTLSAEVRTVDGTIVAQSQVQVASEESPIRMYQDHPLFGVFFHKSLGATTFIPETEMSFIAVPFFAPVSNENDARLVYEWRVNRGVVEPSVRTPSRITINAEGSDGRALIQLALSHVTNFFFGADKSWQVTFSQAGASGGGDTNPFRAQ